MYKSRCSICGNEFSHRFPTQHVCEDCKNRPCEICGKHFKRIDPYDQKYCSKECRRIGKSDPERNRSWTAKRKSTNLQKYGVDNVAKLDWVQNKISDNHHSDDFKNKLKSTNMKRYGVEYTFQAEEVKNKIKQKNTEKYGVYNVSKLESVRQLISERLKDPEIRAKYYETSMKHYGVPHPHMDPEVKAKTEQTMIDHFGVPYYVMLPEYRSARATKQISIINQSVADKLKQQCSLDSEYEFKLGTKFFDIKIRDKNILIEVDPSYTHSNLPNHWCDGLKANYHSDKTQLALDSGYRCIHIFDWDDIDKICMLLNTNESIYARKCKLVDIDFETSSEFINKYHIQGNAKGTLKAYGLYYNGKLVEVMTFGKARYNKNYQYELIRLCTRSGLSVIGGASRLFNHFIKDANPESIISYCDRAKFIGSVYSKIGMKLHHISEPAKVWSLRDKHITDNLLRQRGYDQLFGTNYGKGTSNEELMIKDGWRSVYDCGQFVYVWNNTMGQHLN